MGIKDLDPSQVGKSDISSKLNEYPPLADQKTEFPGQIDGPYATEVLHRKNPVVAIKGESIDGVVKEFILLDSDDFMFMPPESLVFNLETIKSYDLAAALIAHLKVHANVDIRIGPSAEIDAGTGEVILK